MNLLLSIATVVFVVYVIAVVIYIILENRTPQSTFAWLFLFITFPLVGLIVYHFFGRGWRTFSQERSIAREDLASDFLRDLRPILDRQTEYIERIASERPESFRKKLLRLVQRNSSSILTGCNEVEVLQDASQK